MTSQKVKARIKANKARRHRWRIRRLRVNDKLSALNQRRLINVIREMAYRLYKESGYKPVKDLIQAHAVNPSSDYIMAVDPCPDFNVAIMRKPNDN